MLREIQGVASGRKNCVERRLPRRTMIGMVDRSAAERDRARIVGEDDVGPIRANEPYNLLAQLERIDKLAVVIVEEHDPLGPRRLRGIELLLPAQRREALA